MATVAGYANTYPTPYGDAGFWVVTDLHLLVDIQANTSTISVTLSGYSTEDAADAGMLSMGKYTFMMTMEQFINVYTVAQPAVQEAILASDPAWANATYIPPA